MATGTLDEELINRLFGKLSYLLNPKNSDKEPCWYLIDCFTYCVVRTLQASKVIDIVSAILIWLSLIWSLWPLRIFKSLWLSISFRDLYDPLRHSNDLKCQFHGLNDSAWPLFRPLSLVVKMLNEKIRVRSCDRYRAWQSNPGYNLIRWGISNEAKI